MERIGKDSLRHSSVFQQSQVTLAISETTKGDTTINTKNYKGFTLVELLVTIAIIGLLATIAFVSLNRARVKARDAKRLSDLRQLQSALELYFSDNGKYPDPGEDADGEQPVALVPTYLSALPIPPPQNDGDCDNEGTYGQSTEHYPYMNYTDAMDRGTNVPAGTKSVDANQGTPCMTQRCEAYVMTTCLGAPTAGLAAGVVRATELGISN